LGATAHDVGVDAQRERRVCVPELVHDVGGVLADRDQYGGEGVSELVRADSLG
jgi:hypothetical protein